MVVLMVPVQLVAQGKEPQRENLVKTGQLFMEVEAVEAQMLDMV